MPAPMLRRLSDAGVRNSREQALRAVRRSQRTLDSKIEVMERRLDRSIENKTRINIQTAASTLGDFKDSWTLMRELEQKMADMLNVFIMTS